MSQSDPNSMHLLEWGIASRAMEGQAESGDGHFVEVSASSALVAVVDGLGHGIEAASASRLALSIVAKGVGKSVVSIVQACHEALKGSRGVVMSLASFNSLDNTMTWIGVGNIEGRLLHSDSEGGPSHDSMVQRAGVLGHQLPGLRATVIPVSPGDTLLFFTDGVESGFTVVLPWNGTPARLAEHIMNQHKRRNDDALVLVACYKGCPK